MILGTGLMYVLLLMCKTLNPNYTPKYENDITAYILKIIPGEPVYQLQVCTANESSAPAFCFALGSFVLSNF